MAEEKSQHCDSVCVTGAGGFIASWLVKLLLSKGYIVHGTVRNLGDQKNAHLYKMDKANQNLKLFKADLLNYESLRSAIEDCVGVFHVASPLILQEQVQDTEKEVMEPSVTGTVNVLKACMESKVKRVIYVSSSTAIFMNPKWPKHQVMDESCWSDPEFQKAIKFWYGVSKTLAEIKAKEFAEESGLDIVRICPVTAFGPMLQPTMNTTTAIFLRFLKDGLEPIDNRLWRIVDVRDLADALLLAYEKPEAEGRYICASYMIKARDLIDKFKSIYPHYNYPKSFREVEEEPDLSSEKLQSLGWKYRALETTVIDSVECFREDGILN